MEFDCRSSSLLRNDTFARIIGLKKNTQCFYVSRSSFSCAEQSYRQLEWKELREERRPKSLVDERKREIVAGETSDSRPESAGKTSRDRHKILPFSGAGFASVSSDLTPFLVSRLPFLLPPPCFPPSSPSPPELEQMQTPQILGETVRSQEIARALFPFARSLFLPFPPSSSPSPLRFPLSLREIKNR